MRKFDFLARLGIESVHCMGIGGIGVSGLAEILLQAGYRVSGSDCNHSPVVKRLQKLGVALEFDGSLAAVAAADCVIYSRAIAADDPEMKIAKERGIPIYSRGEFLAQLVAGVPALVVAGSHGKSTTSGWATHALKTADISVNSYLGAVIQGQETTVQMLDVGLPWVMESDESDGSCFLLKPACLVITNIDADHLETYAGSLAVLQDRMVDWANAMGDDGVAVVCIDDPGVQAILPRLRCRTLTYGFSSEADFQLLECKQQGAFSELCWQTPDGERCSAPARLPGKHNALNGLAAWIACQQFVPLDGAPFTQAWSQYPGVKRRMSIRGAVPFADGEALVIEDYGHHPREMQVTLDALKLAWPERRVVMLFQPHRYTRTRDLFDEFVSVLSAVEALHLLPIYTAGEEPIANISTDKLALAIELSGSAQPDVYNGLEQAVVALRQVLRPGDLLLLQGAGSVGNLADEFCAGSGDGTEEKSSQSPTQ